MEGWDMEGNESDQYWSLSIVIVAFKNSQELVVI